MPRLTSRPSGLSVAVTRARLLEVAIMEGAGKKELGELVAGLRLILERLEREEKRKR